MLFNVEKMTPIALWLEGRYLFRLDVLVQVALLVLLATATWARFVAANLNGIHLWLKACWALTTLRQNVIHI